MDVVKKVRDFPIPGTPTDVANASPCIANAYASQSVTVATVFANDVTLPPFLLTFSS